MREDSGIAPGLISLPDGGGGVGSLGDRFQPDLVRGSGGYAVSIDCPKGPNDLQPSLSLAYSTGSGNGPFGLGWRLNLMRIERRSDRGVPGYTDDDTFVIGDAEVLVPVGGGRYRPKTDSKFWMIERVGDTWHIRTGDGKLMLFGQTAASRESGPPGVFAWYLDEERDAAGNGVFYSYLENRGRLYPESVRYSIFEVRFVYEARPDSTRNGRAGFARAMALRAKAVEMHCTGLAPTLLRTYSLAYTQAQNGVSLLSRYGLSASDGASVSSAPELGFDYSATDFTAWNVHEIASLIRPPSLDDRTAQLVDMTGDGLPDVLQSLGPRMLLWRNRGDGSLEGPTAIDGVPSTVSLSRDNVALADLDGDGRVDLFAADQPLQLAFVANGKGGFQSDPVVFRSRPNLRLSSSDTRLMDVDGDGVTDLIGAERDYFLLFRHVSGEGWQQPDAVARVADLEHFPDVAFEDRGVRLADMTGDGLEDIVAIRSGDVSYWPYFGNGVWGGRVQLENPPQFPPGYRDDRMHSLDLDGDGCTDIVYFDNDRTWIWLNRSGGSFAPPIQIPVTPITRTARIFPADFFGDGVLGFLWSAAATGQYSSGYRFLRFDQGRKAYLMTSIENGLGRRTEIEYSPTTVMRLEDETSGGWAGQLPFVVNVVRAIHDRDSVTGAETQISIRYRDAVYDGPQREFRGFGRATVDMAGDDSVPGSRQEYTFLQGDPDEADLVERERQRALAGSMVSLRTLEQTATGYELRHEFAQTWDTRVEFDDGARRVFFSFLKQTENREQSPGVAPRRIERTQLLAYDAHGNAGQRVREYFVEGDAPANALSTEERFVYTGDEARWLVKLPVRCELRDGAGVPFSVKIHYYDGPAFVGLAEGSASSGLLTRTQELAMADARLPGDYLGGRDLTALGYERLGAADTVGFYATTMAVRRDGKGNIIEHRDATGAGSQTGYDADGVFPVQRIDPLGKVTKTSFNPKSAEPARVELPDGRVFRFVTDLLGRTIAQFELDDAGVEQLVKCWAVQVASLPASVTAFAPAHGARLLSEFLNAADPALLPDVSVDRAYLDGFGNQTLRVRTAPDGPAGVRRFVASGQTRSNSRKKASLEFPPVFVPNLSFIPLPAAGSARVRRRYDALLNLIETAGPGPAHFRVLRDNFTLEHFEGASAGPFGVALPPGPPTRIERFDARNRAIGIEESKGDGTVIATSYDLSVDGRIQAIRDNAGVETARYTFAGPGEPVRIAHRDMGTQTYYRDAAGRLVELVRADGSRLLYRFDGAGRLIRIEHTAAHSAAVEVVREIFFDADPGAPSAGRFLNDRTALVRESGVEMRYSYNRAGSTLRRETTVAGTTLAMQWEYNLRQNATALTYPDGHRIAYTLDASGTVQQIPGAIARVSYTEEGIVDGYTFANGVEASLPLDASSRRLNNVSAKLGGAMLRNIAYSYDEVGNITGLEDATPLGSEHQTFAYDGLYRVANYEARSGNAAGAVLRAEQYRYDAEGNLLQLGSQSLSYGDAVHPGRVTAVTSGARADNVQYDDRASIRAWGNLAAIEFDPLDRLSRATLGDGSRLRFAYDPQNGRVLKEVTAGAGVSITLYASNLFEKRGANAVRHVYLGNRLVASDSVSGGVTATAFFLYDHHGTLVLATDSAAGILQNQRYAPFGLALDAGASLDRYLGIERDVELGLVQLGARYYAPAIGRFISPDWYVIENPTRPMRMPQGFNVYSYALNNPLVFKDPSGKWFFLIPFVVGFVAGLIYGLADGQKWDAFGTALETGLTTGFGALLGGAALGTFGAVMGGINGLFTGTRQIYDWGSLEGWASFVTDSTWGIVGTSIGNVLNVVNLIGGSSYDSANSRRQNRQVYDKGFAFDSGAAFTQGNVISNLNGGGGTGILRHESVHIFQNRLLGPIYTAGYALWLGYGAYYGFWLGLALWAFTGEDPISAARDVAYDDNPFEMWAYSVQGDDGKKGKLAL
jgi:RHS repeat-associated protein